jgi:hypothetical protein
MPNFLNEHRILTTSQPWVNVEFRVEDGEGDGGNDIIILPRDYITSASFSGVAIGARQGKINIVDPTNAWVGKLNKIGLWKNNHPYDYNMKVNFGWKGLRPDNNNTNVLNYIKAILLQTKFAMKDDGSTTIEFNFIENTENLLGAITFNRLLDMKLLDSNITTNMKGMKIHEVLQYISGYKVESKGIQCPPGRTENQFGIAQQLIDSKLLLKFKDTFETDNHAYGEDGKDIVIRLGDKLADKINEAIAMAMPQDPKDEKNAWSYEMSKRVGETLTDDERGNYTFGNVTYPDGVQCVIEFSWVSTPVDMTDEDSIDEQKARSNNTERGPILLWKKKSTGLNTKELLTFDVDLKMLDFAASMIKDKMTSAFNNLEEKDWEAVEKSIKALPDNSRILFTDPTELASMGLNPNDNITYTNNPHWYDMFGLSNRAVEERETGKILQEFNKVLKDTINNVSNSIEAVIRKNVFKAKARIQGDPSLGTINTVYKCGFPSDFSSVGSFAKLFNKFWTLTKVEHIIDESGFWTDIELMAIPPKINPGPARPHTTF